VNERSQAPSASTALRVRGTSRAVWTLILLILAELVIVQSLHVFSQVSMVDFYQYWAVSNARRVSSQTLRSPYTDRELYYTTLADQAARSDDARLLTVNRVYPRPGFTATPLAYVLFAALPANYTLANALYYALQILAFPAAVIVLGIMYGYEVFPLLCLALLLVLASGPFSADVRVGNVGCFQLLALAGLLTATDRLRRSARPVLLGGVVASGLVLLVLAKPNVALVCAVIMLHLCLVHGARRAAVASAAAVLCGAAAAIIACAYFDSWSVWWEWYRFIFGGNPYALTLAPPIGNYASARLLSSVLGGADVWLIVVLIAAALAASTIVVIAGRLGTTATGDAPARRMLGMLRDDVHVAVAIGVTLTIALSPLGWYHYYVLAVIPSLWLLNATSASPYLPLWGLAALVLSSGIVNVVFLPLGWARAAAFGAALTWVPLWGGILHRLCVTRPEERSAEPTVAAADQARTFDKRPARSRGRNRGTVA